MKQHLRALPVCLALAAASDLPAATPEPAAEESERTALIALKTDGFELAETDISRLSVGESKTIVTDNGTTVDLIRTREGVEIYVDGVLLDAELGHTMHALAHDSLAGAHESVELHCPEPGPCSKTIRITRATAGSGLTVETDDATQLIERHVEVHCPDGESCDEQLLWISDADITGLHGATGEKQVHVLRLHEGGDADSETTEKKIIVMQRHSHD